jgi:hypothetical protein
MTNVGGSSFYRIENQKELKSKRTMKMTVKNSRAIVARIYLMGFPHKNNWKP